MFNNKTIIFTKLVCKQEQTSFLNWFKQLCIYFELLFIVDKMVDIDLQIHFYFVHK